MLHLQVGKTTWDILIKAGNGPYTNENGSDFPLALFGGKPGSQLVQEFLQREFTKSCWKNPELDLKTRLEKIRIKFQRWLRNLIPDNRTSQNFLAIDYPWAGLEITETNEETGIVTTAVMGDVFLGVKFINGKWYFSEDYGGIHEAILDDAILRYQREISIELKYGEFEQLSKADPRRQEVVDKAMAKHFLINRYRKILDINSKLPTGYRVFGINTPKDWFEIRQFKLVDIDRIFMGNTAFIPWLDPKAVLADMNLQVNDENLRSDVVTGIDFKEIKRRLNIQKSNSIRRAFRFSSKDRLVRRADKWREQDKTSYGGAPNQVGGFIEFIRKAA